MNLQHIFSFTKSKNQESDKKLISCYKENNDASALEELFQRYIHIVFFVCKKYLKDEEESKDAVMEIFEKLVIELKEHDISNFKGWLYTVIKNYCLMKKRKINSIELIVNRPDNIDLISMENADLDNRIYDEEIKSSDLNAALNQLNEAQRKCIELFYFKEKTYQVIAGMTDFNIKQVKSHIQNGKRNLKNILSQREKINND